MSGRKSERQERALATQAKSGNTDARGDDRGAGKGGAEPKPKVRVQTPKKAELRSSTAFFGRLQDAVDAAAKGHEALPKKAPGLSKPTGLSAARLKL